MSIAGEPQDQADLAAQKADADEFRVETKGKAPSEATLEGGERDQRIADLATEALSGLTPEQIDLIAEQLHPEQRQKIIEALERHRAIEEISAFLDQFKAPNQEASGNGEKKVEFVFLDQKVLEEKGYKDAQEVLELVARYRQRLEKAKGQKEPIFTLKDEDGNLKSADENPLIQPGMSGDVATQFGTNIAETPPQRSWQKLKSV